MSMMVTVRRQIRIHPRPDVGFSGVTYAPRQEIDLETWAPVALLGRAKADRLARQFSEQGHFMRGFGATFATHPGPASSRVKGANVEEAEDTVDLLTALQAELKAANDALEHKDALVRGQLEVNHKGHKVPASRCPSPACTFFREVLAVSASEPFDTSKVA